MENRVEKLEEFAVETRERLARIESRLEQMVTKADLHEFGARMQELNATTVRWIVGIGVGMGIAAITVMTFVLNNAAPKPPAPPPVVIQLSAPAVPTAPVPRP
ncbi:MAG: hypothetical protein ACEQSK_18915 [Sphingomonadaceae bacterium]